jgi:hypothetical protein
VPISLAGRPFLRLDEVIGATLLNTLRFPHMYLDSFIELVRLGILVPALDGFEEIFVETDSADAVSGLGLLIRQLASSGTMVVAARKAYFHFRSLAAQAKLLDDIRTVDVQFFELRLDRWDESHFVQYASRRGITDASSLYDTVASRLSGSHPVLTRAVLAKRLVDLVLDADDRSEIVSKLRPEAEDFFFLFIGALLDRERLKWITKGGDAATPLLTIEEHHDLLGRVAEEMWLGKTRSLRGDLLDAIADLFSEELGKRNEIARQVRERIKQHALLVGRPPQSREFEFDHDEFFHFFLGERIARFLMVGDFASGRLIMAVDTLPGEVINVVAAALRRHRRDRRTISRQLADQLKPEGRFSASRENVGALASVLLEGTRGESIVLDKLAFPPDCLRHNSFCDVVFRNCYFHSTSLEGSQLTSCAFHACEFESLEIRGDVNLADTKIHAGCQVHSVSYWDGEDEVSLFAPAQIESLLSRVGFTIIEHHEAAYSSEAKHSLDTDSKLFQRVLRTFQRSTTVGMSIFKLRLGQGFPHFDKIMLPQLLAAGILEEIQNTGSGTDRRFRLAVPLEGLQEALAEVEGDYTSLLKVFEAP